MTESWTCQHFSLSGPKGASQGDVPALLRSVARNIEEYGEVEVQDIVFRVDRITEDGDWPSVTVYFSYPDPTEPQPLRPVEQFRPRRH